MGKTLKEYLFEICMLQLLAKRQNKQAKSYLIALMLLSIKKAFNLYCFYPIEKVYNCFSAQIDIAINQCLVTLLHCRDFHAKDIFAEYLCWQL